MAKVHLDRLQSKYKDIPVKGKVYEHLVNTILEVNTGNIQRKMSRMTEDKFKKKMKKDSRFVLPDITDVLPKRAVLIRKAAEKGNLIRDTLRDQLTKDLRDTLKDFPEESFTTRRGTTAGRINKKLIDQFEQKITETFEGYTRKDKKFGMPKNIHTIAVTEVRGTVNEIKKIYVDKFQEKNPDAKIKKRWIQNRSLSKNPRRGHDEVNGKIISFDKQFKVPFYRIVRGKRIKEGITMMDHPHSPGAPAVQVVNCSCDYDIIIG